MIEQGPHSYSNRGAVFLDRLVEPAGRHQGGELGWGSRIYQIGMFVACV
jgi:hypothetical protein